MDKSKTPTPLTWEQIGVGWKTILFLAMLLGFYGIDFKAAAYGIMCTAWIVGTFVMGATAYMEFKEL